MKSKYDGCLKIGYENQSFKVMNVVNINYKNKGRSKVNILCSCGKEKECYISTAISAKGCGCYKAKKFIGEVLFNRECINYAGQDKRGNYLLSFRCIDCQDETVVKLSRVNNGLGRCLCNTPEKHGYTESRTYSSWENMKQRCNNPNTLNFDRYGGRGITVCQEWEDSFLQFLSDMGERPEDCTLDRIDANKGYYPDNCRWADEDTQRINTVGHGGIYSKFKGAYYRKDRGTWFSSIKYKENSKHLGKFDSEIEAAKAWDIEAKKLGLVTNEDLGLYK